MTDADREKLNAAVLFTDTSGINSLCRLAENLDLFGEYVNITSENDEISENDEPDEGMEKLPGMHEKP